MSIRGDAGPQPLSARLAEEALARVAFLENRVADAERSRRQLDAVSDSIAVADRGESPHDIVLHMYHRDMGPGLGRSSITRSVPSPASSMISRRSLAAY